MNKPRDGMLRLECIGEGEDVELWLHIDHQSFRINGGLGFDDRKHAEWMGKQLTAALTRYREHNIPAEGEGAPWGDFSRAELADIAEDLTTKVNADPFDGREPALWVHPATLRRTKHERDTGSITRFMGFDEHVSAAGSDVYNVPLYTKD